MRSSICKLLAFSISILFFVGCGSLREPKDSSASDTADSDSWTEDSSMTDTGTDDSGVTDSDGDGVNNRRDNCTNTDNPNQKDSDRDGTGNVCDSDRDGDTVANSSDNCPDTANQNQTDSDGDDTGDACESSSDSDSDGVDDSSDQCSGTPANTKVDSSGCSDAQVDQDGDGICDPNATSSGPSGCSGSDNCPSTANSSQKDSDSDGTGDACDSDRDGDGIDNGQDNCPDTTNASQADSDGDGTGDACEDKLTISWKPGSSSVPSNVKTLYLKAECKSGSGFALSWPSGANGHDSDSVGGNSDELSHTVQLSNGVDYCKMNVAGADSGGNIVWWNPGSPHGSVGDPLINIKGTQIVPSANSNGFGGLQWEVNPAGNDTDADGSCDPNKSGPDCSGTDSASYDGTTQ